MKTKHTPGPWKVKNFDTIVGPNGNVIAECCGYSDKATDKDQKKQGGRESNAKAISALPDIIESLEELIKLYSLSKRNNHYFIVKAISALMKAGLK